MMAGEEVRPTLSTSSPVPTESTTRVFVDVLHFDEIDSNPPIIEAFITEAQEAV